MGETTDSDVAAFEALQSRLEKEHPHELAVFQGGKLLATGKDYGEALDRALAHPESRKDRNFFINWVGPYDKDLLCLF